MRIASLSAYDTFGGAAKAAYRLHKALISIGIDSFMLVKRKLSEDPRVISQKNKERETSLRVKLFLERVPIKMIELIEGRDIREPFSIAWMPSTKIISMIEEINPDIVHLHWICDGTLSIEDLPSIRRPIVWSLHDMWAFTGGCHCSDDCERYKAGCGRCRVMSSNEKEDLSRFVWLRKRKSFLKMRDLTIVGVSRWIAERAKESPLLKGKRIIHIPNPVDTEIFKPSPLREGREKFNLPKEKRLILFGAIGAIEDERKGFMKLREALNKMNREDVELVVFGSERSKDLPSLSLKVHYLGRIEDEKELALLYSACDLMVVPSKQEAFGQTAAEALSCGTPVVAFGCTGLTDIVDHKINGYLAKPYDIDDLRRGIEWVLERPNPKELSFKAREKVKREFDSKLVAQRYAKLYEELAKPRSPCIHHT